MELISVQTPGQLECVKALFLEYAASIDFDLCFQNFEEELAGLPGAYAPPDGSLLLAMDQNTAAGCVGLRKWGVEIAEMKRLYVRPPFRQKGIGRALTNAIIKEAGRLGYQSLRLDTVPEMQPAQALYESLGFKDIPAFAKNPIAGARFLELKLTS